MYVDRIIIGIYWMIVFIMFIVVDLGGLLVVIKVILGDFIRLI